MRAEFTFEKAVEADALELALCMRTSDLDELAVMGDCDPYRAALTSIQRSYKAVTVRRAATRSLVCVYGFAPLASVGGAAPWMMGTDLLDKAIKTNRKQLLTRGRIIIAAAKMVYPQLWNVVSASNHASIRFLRHLGFEIGPTLLMPSGGYIRPFRMGLEDNTHV